jgi:hypothetical protein
MKFFLLEKSVLGDDATEPLSSDELDLLVVDELVSDKDMTRKICESFHIRIGIQHPGTSPTTKTNLTPNRNWTNANQQPRPVNNKMKGLESEAQGTTQRHHQRRRS